MQLDPAIVTREFAAKGQEVFKRELMTKVHVETCGKLWATIRPKQADLRAFNP
jgi:hypothetical protein